MEELMWKNRKSLKHMFFYVLLAFALFFFFFSYLTWGLEGFARELL